MEDFTSIEWDEFDNFEALVEQEADFVDLQAGIDEVVDRMMISEGYYDRVVGWF